MVGDPARIRKRSVVVSGHPTSVTMEDAFWKVLQDIAETRNVSLNQLVSEVDRSREGNLSSALRVFVLRWVRGRQETRG